MQYYYYYTLYTYIFKLEPHSSFFQSLKLLVFFRMNIRKTYEPVPNSRLIKMVVFNVKLGHHNELYRPVTRADFDSSNIDIGTKVAVTIDELQNDAEIKARACPAWFNGHSFEGRVCQKIKFAARTSSFCLSSSDKRILDVDTMEKHGLINDGHVDIKQVRKTVEDLEQKVQSLQAV